MSKKCKNLLIVLSALIVGTGLVSPMQVQASSQIEAVLNFETGKATVNGTPVETTSMPYLSDTGRSMVGIRDLAVFLGIEDKDIVFENGVVTITHGAEVFSIENGARRIHFESTRFIDMDETMQIVDGRAYAPIKFIAYALDLEVSYDGVSKIATFTGKTATNAQVDNTVIVEVEADDTEITATEADNSEIIDNNRASIVDNYKDSAISISSSTSRWASAPQRYLFEENNTLFLVDNDGSNIIIQGFDPDTLEQTLAQTLPLSLPLFGGFHETDDYYFVVTGQENMEELKNLEVIRIEKYDKNFKLQGTTSVMGGDVYVQTPFHSGSVSMASNGDTLILHTARRAFASSSDGLNHQMQLTLEIDTKTMNYEFRTTSTYMQPNHVSHSFNQFVQYDGNQAVFLDHGDAYPRAVVITEYKSASSFKDSQTEILDIPGTVGANQTGLTVGGFEVGKTNYVTAISLIDYDTVSGFTSFDIQGITKQERDIVVLTTNKSTGKTNEVYITNYTNTNKFGSTPKLVKLDDGNFMVMWIEFDCTFGSSGNPVAQSEAMKYVVIDENGKQLSSIETLGNGQLSQYVQPIVQDNKVVWFSGIYYYYVDIPRY
ncbi:MAG: hypothetical protein ATN35_10285 [Epulopiscium sp. Nele67-Bin004]|nr:MAG: hypothetical protein ATN35_10285 [Epulopiscium sp. Nele67-Bin004]